MLFRSGSTVITAPPSRSCRATTLPPISSQSGAAHVTARAWASSLGMPAVPSATMARCAAITCIKGKTARCATNWRTRPNGAQSRNIKPWRSHRHHFVDNGSKTDRPLGRLWGLTWANATIFVPQLRGTKIVGHDEAMYYQNKKVKLVFNNSNNMFIFIDF